MRDNWDMVRDT